MKYEKEITVSVNISKEKLIEFLNKNNYNKIDSYTIDDIYYVEKETDLNQNSLDVLKKCVLIRSIDKAKHYIMYKYKEYDKNENIINQGKLKVQILNKNDAKSFLDIIGYKELIHISDYIEVYKKNNLELCVEYVNKKYLYIEVEENKEYNTIEKLIEGLEQTNIDYDKNDYFVKKAKIIFEENYNN